MIADRSTLEILAARGLLSRSGLAFALRQLGIPPRTDEWRHFADRVLLAGGMLLLLAGIIFFFAFNWSELHRGVKLALVALPLLGAAAGSWYCGLDRLAGQTLMAAAVVLIGANLAVAGQIYQSGADSEWLFIGWAALALPWVAATQTSWLWLFWLAIVNTALGLYVFGRFEIWAALWLRDSIFWLPILINGLAIAIWEFLWPRCAFLRAPYAPRLLAFAAGAYATILMSLWWFHVGKNGWQLLEYTPTVYLVWLAGTFWHYSGHRRDIVPLAVGAFSLIVVITAGLGRALLHRHFEVGSLLLIGLAVAGMTALAASWLRRLSRQWQESSHV